MPGLESRGHDLDALLGGRLRRRYISHELHVGLEPASHLLQEQQRDVPCGGATRDEEDDQLHEQEVNVVQLSIWSIFDTTVGRLCNIECSWWLCCWLDILII